MVMHEKQHSSHCEAASLESLSSQECQAQAQVVQETKPRIQVKNPAELIEKPEESLTGGDMENRSMMDEKEPEIHSPDANKTTGEFSFLCGHEPVHLYSIVL